RTLGIPSRIAFGFGYVNGILGGHAWTEILIGNTWVGVDGALVPNTSVDAARFAFAHASLAGGPGELTNSAGAQLYGRLAADVLGYQVEGEPFVTTRGGAAPYRIQADRYINASLSVELRKPAGFHFIELDETWPAMTIVSIADDAGDTVRVSSIYRAPWIEAATAAGQSRVATTRRATLAVPNGGETIVVDAAGPASRRALEQVRAGLALRSVSGQARPPSKIAAKARTRPAE